MPKFIRYILPFLIIAIAIAVVVMLYVLRPTPVQLTPKFNGVPVRVLTLATGAFAPTFGLFGTLESPQSSELEVAQTAYVQAIPKLEGELVKKDDVIVQMDARDAQFLVEQRQGEVKQLKAQIASDKNRYASDLVALKHEQRLLTLAENSVDREDYLIRSKVGAQSNKERAQQTARQAELAVTERKQMISDHKHRLASLEGQLLRSEAMLKQAQLDLTRSQIRAPFDGRITKLNVAVGDRVKEGEIVLTLFDTSHVEIRAQIPSRYLKTTHALLVDKKEIKAWTLINGKRYDLQLLRLAGEVAKGRAGVDGLFRVLGDAKNISLGRTVPVTVQLPKRQGVFAIPITSLYGSDRVYKVVNSQLKLVKIERIGGYVSPEGQPYYLVKSDILKTGDQLITTQLPQVATGLKVKVIDD